MKKIMSIYITLFFMLFAFVTLYMPTTNAKYTYFEEYGFSVSSIQKKMYFFPYEEPKPKTIEIEYTGVYILQVWGGDGGNMCKATTTDCHTMDNTLGYGGYIGGQVILKKGDTLTIYVGGRGDEARAYPDFAAGGYNGGGYGSHGNGNDGGGGGGASDIRLNALDDPDNLENRIIVAGGGGGGGGSGSPLPWPNNTWNIGGNAGALECFTCVGDYGYRGRPSSDGQSLGGTLPWDEPIKGAVLGKGADNLIFGSTSGGGGGGYYGGLSAYGSGGGGGSSALLASTMPVEEKYIPLLTRERPEISKSLGNGCVVITYIDPAYKYIPY